MIRGELALNLSSFPLYPLFQKHKDKHWMHMGHAASEKPCFQRKLQIVETKGSWLGSCSTHFLCVVHDPSQAYLTYLGHSPHRKWCWWSCFPSQQLFFSFHSHFLQIRSYLCCRKQPRPTLTPTCDFNCFENNLN